MPARSSSPNRTNTLTKGSIRTQVELVYGHVNRMSLLAGYVVATAVSEDELSMVSIHFDRLIARNVIRFLDTYNLWTKMENKSGRWLLWRLEKQWNFKIAQW